MMAALARYIILHDTGLTWNLSGGGNAIHTTDDKRIAFISSNREKMLESCRFAKEGGCGR